jgi:ankyrin repeat protein
MRPTALRSFEIGYRPVMTPLFEAILANDLDALAAMLKRTPALSSSRAEADLLVDAIPHWLYVGDTPLHLAAAATRVGAASLLLGAGADVNASNRRGATALHYACDPRPRSGGTWDPALQGQLIDLLVRHGGAVDLADRGGAVALHRAVRARSPTAVRHLLQSGAGVGSRLGKRGSTALHLAAQSTGAGGTAGTLAEQLAIIATLLEHGADRLARDAEGKTVLDWAKSQPIVAALQPAGAPPEPAGASPAGAARPPRQTRKTSRRG